MNEQQELTLEISEAREKVLVAIRMFCEYLVSTRDMEYRIGVFENRAMEMDGFLSGLYWGSLISRYEYERLCAMLLYFAWGVERAERLLTASKSEYLWWKSERGIATPGVAA